MSRAPLRCLLQAGLVVGVGTTVAWLINYGEPTVYLTDTLVTCNEFNIHRQTNAPKPLPLLQPGKRFVDTPDDPSDWPGPKVWPFTMVLLDFFAINIFGQALARTL